MTYIDYATQEGRILQLLRQRGQRGVFVWEFMLPRNQGGLGVAQYNARIYGLRAKGLNIVCQAKGHYILNEGVEKPTPDWRLEKRKKRIAEMEDQGQEKLI